MENQLKDKVKFIVSMLIFATIGIFRREIVYSSSVVALIRAGLGSTFLLCTIFLIKGRLDMENIKKNFLVLLFSGIFLGANWIFLFEAYQFTSVSLATLSYYMAPIIVIFVSPIIIGEKVTRAKRIFAYLAVFGMALVSGIFSSKVEGTKGIIFGLVAAVFYSFVMILNKKIKTLDSFESTVSQLFIAFVTLLPYVLLTESVDFSDVSTKTILLLLIVGIIHTGISYLLYFSSVGKLPVQTSAIFSYIDPIVAILLSVFLLKESITTWQAFGAALVIGAMIASELYGQNPRPE